MESKYNYELIRDYLHGVVDQATASRIRDLIRNDEVARSIAAGILQLEHEFNGDDDQIDSYIETLRQKQLKLIAEQGKTRTMSRGWIRIAAAIAIIAVAAPVLWLTLFQNNSVLTEELREPYPLTVDRGASDKVEGYGFYLNGEYKKATTSFNQVTDDVTATFYNGLSHLYLGDYTRAVELLSSGSLPASRYRQQAEWFRTLALIKAGKKEDAKAALQLIIQNPSHYKSSAALRLLEELE